MGAAVWLYGWLVLRQTRQEAGIGWVLGGKPVSYREIEEETGFERKTLERWMRALRLNGYIETRTAPAGVIVRITKAKKFTRPTPTQSAEVTKRIPETLHLNFEGSGLKNEAGAPQIRKRERADRADSRTFAPPIGSGSVVREEKDNRSGSENRFLRGVEAPVAAPPCRAPADSWRDIRSMKEELLRRELNVGAGPGVRRPAK